MADQRVMLVTHNVAMAGTDRVAVHLANGFVQQFRTLFFHAARSHPAAKLVEMLDPAVERVSADRTSRSRNFNLNTALPNAIAAVRRFRPDLIVGTGNNNSLFATLVHLANPNPRGRLAIKVTSPILRGRDMRFKRWFRRTLYSWIFARSSVVLALSEREADDIVALFPTHAGKVRVARNPYVTDTMLAVPDPDIAEGPLRFLSLGRINKQKNIPLMLAAWSDAALPDATLNLAGDGPLLQDMQALAVARSIDHSTRFSGYSPDVAPLLQEADCLLLSSDYEGLPAVVLEAFAAGRPVIATDCFPAARELIAGAPGCALVPIKDEVGLSLALRDFARCARQETTNLRARALPYQIDAAVRSHIEALGLIAGT